MSKPTTATTQNATERIDMSAAESIIGKPVYIRSNMSGVWHGTLIEHAPNYSWVRLSDAEHLYRWQTTEGVTIAALASKGLNRARSTVSPLVAVAIVRDVVEILPEN